MLTDKYWRAISENGFQTQTSLEPKNVSKVWDEDNILARVEALENDKNKERVGISVQICDLNNIKYILKKPISLLVFVENGEYYATLIDFDVFGVGEDEKSAIDDLKDVIISYFDSLEASNLKLSKKLQAKFALLQSFISHET